MFCLIEISDASVFSEQLLVAKRAIEQHTETLGRTLDDLDELGGIMTDMLEQQEAVEVRNLIRKTRCAALKQYRQRAWNTSTSCMTT